MVQKLNIAMVCDPVTDYTGGSFISTLRFGELLKEKDHKVIFIAARSPKNPRDNSHNGIPVYRFSSLLLPKTEGRMYISFPTTAKIQKIFKEEKIDVVHIMLPTPSAIACVKAAKLLKIPIVIHSHAQPENLFLHLPKIFFREILNRLFYKYLFWLYKKGDVIVYPSVFAQKIFPKIGNMRTMVVSNGVDMRKFRGVDTRKFYEKFGLSRETKKVLFVGRLHPEKMVDTFIRSVPEVVRKDSNVQFLIVGFGHMEEKLKKLAKDLRMEKHILFFGEVSEEDLIMAYNVGDIFVLPSLAELEGMAVLEAMACGKPIIVADSKESASPFFVDGNGFLFTPGDEKDLSEKILLLLGDEKIRREMGERSLQNSKQYNIHESISKLENLYYSLLKNP